MADDRRSRSQVTHLLQRWRQDTAQVLSMSARTVKREWALARPWLRRELDGAGPYRN
jgi:DNA-directed RNA polymerase specialized sigma24 family protein